jgi:hypothetical protein
VCEEGSGERPFSRLFALLTLSSEEDMDGVVCTGGQEGTHATEGGKYRNRTFVFVSTGK